MLIELQIKLTIRAMVSLAGSGMGKVEKGGARMRKNKCILIPH